MGRWRWRGERRAISRALRPKPGSFICRRVCPSVAPRRTQAGLMVGQDEQTPAVGASGRWVCMAERRTRPSKGSSSVKPTTLKPAAALKEHTCASTCSAAALIAGRRVGEQGRGVRQTETEDNLVERHVTLVLASPRALGPGCGVYAGSV
eukprot:scaffold86313_cov39-Phaeocystis_antarctica.AAC.1